MVVRAGDAVTHGMQLIAEHEGTEEWLCPVCGRMVLIDWMPFHYEIVIPGDESAGHSGSKGGLRIAGVEVEP